MERRGSRTYVRAVIFPGQTVHAVLTEIALLCGLNDRLTDQFTKRLAIKLPWVVNKEKNASGVLTQRLTFYSRKIDVLFDDTHRIFAARIFALLFTADLNGFHDITWEIDGRLPNNLNEAL